MEIPPLPAAIEMWGRFEGQGPIRLLPESYRALPLAAIIIYCIHNGVAVWDQQLRYFRRGAEIAAVDTNNMPLKDFSFDRNGNFLHYAGSPGPWDDVLARITDPALRLKATQDYSYARSQVLKLMEWQNEEQEYWTP